MAEIKGYVYCHRKTQLSELWELPDHFYKLFKLLTWDAIRTPGDLYGTVVVSYGDLARRMPKHGNYTRHKIRGMVKALEQMGMVTAKSLDDRMVIEIHNYGKYQQSTKQRQSAHAHFTRGEAVPQSIGPKEESDEYQARYREAFNAIPTRCHEFERGDSRAELKVEDDPETQFQCGCNPDLEYEIEDDFTR